MSELFVIMSYIKLSPNESGRRNWVDLYSLYQFYPPPTLMVATLQLACNRDMVETTASNIEKTSCTSVYILLLYLFIQDCQSKLHGSCVNLVVLYVALYYATCCLPLM
jgi:hypothetical protein